MLCFHLFHFFGNHAKIDILRFFRVGFARFWNMEDFRLAGTSGEALRLGSPWLGHIKLSLVNHAYLILACCLGKQIMFSLIVLIVLGITSTPYHS